MPKLGYGFAFNGVRSDDMGVALVWYPELPRARRDARAVRVPGRSGALTVDDGSYAPIKFSLICRIKDGADRAAISAWLTGPGELSFDEEPGFCYRAALTEEFRYARFMPRSFAADLSVAVDAQPFRYQTPPARLTLSAAGFVTNPGTLLSEPILTLAGSGDAALLVGGATLLISGMAGQLVVDCEQKVAYTPGSGGAPGTLMTSNVTGEWPVFPVGTTPVSWTGALTGVSIQPNWRWL